MATRGTNFRVLEIRDPEGDESVNIYVRYNWYYDPGCSHMSNGDPGYPSESEVEIIEYHISEDPKAALPDWFDLGLIEEQLWEEGDVFESDYDPEDYKD
jgi:hypothetical protein